MKNLTKLMVALFIFTLTTESFAQRIGIRAGAVMTNMLMKDDEDTYSDDFKMKPGFTAGVVGEIPFNDMFYFEPGLMLTTKGFKLDSEETMLGFTIKTEASSNPLYIDIPLNFKVAGEVGDEIKIYGLAGPYIGLGIGGKMKSKIEGMGEVEETDEAIKWGSDEDEDDFKMLDFGVTVGAGVEFGPVQAGLFYGLGLANISPYTDGGAKIANRTMGLTVTWFFGEN
ncbi:MAG TPA: porin family protein [Lentimicrobium sp.]|nr:porin family protein [Lentimicrobium sp.]